MWRVSAVVLSAVISCGVATATELSKEGTFNAIYSAVGIWKGSGIGKGRFLSTWDENAFTVGSGPLDHMTWHCFGLNDNTAGKTVAHGYCVVTDADGDQIVADLITDKHAWDAKDWNGSTTFTTGTGKYAGITGSTTFVAHSGEFRPTAEGTYFISSDVQGSYKLP
jgi:hypothetical protein